MNQNSRKLLKENIGFDSSDADCTTTTEEMEPLEEGMSDEIEAYVKEEVGLWLANHGSKLFQLESSKFLALEFKKKPSFQVGRPSKK